MARSRKDNVTPEQMARFLELVLEHEGGTPVGKKKVIDWLGVTERTYRSYINKGSCAKKWRIQKVLSDMAEELTRNLGSGFTHPIYVSYCKYVFEGVEDWEGLAERLQTAPVVVDALLLAKQYTLMGGQTRKRVDELFLTIEKAGLSGRHYESVFTKEPNSHYSKLHIEPDTQETRVECAVEDYFSDQVAEQYRLGMSYEDLAKYD